MRSIDINLFDAFSDQLFGGNVAGVVTQAQSLDDREMQAVAREIAAPVTGFASMQSPKELEARFFTPTREIAMCGHVIVGLFTQLAEDGRLNGGAGDTVDVRLTTKAGPVDVEVRRQDGRTDLIMMRQNKPAFQSCDVDRQDIAGRLGIFPDAIDPDFPMEIGSTGLKHLFVPLRGLEVMRDLCPDMGALTELSGRLGVDTVAVFTREAVDPGYDIHSRDFCPAVGVPEAPASGTTNGALTCYLIRNGIMTAGADGSVTVLAEQGYEMGRPSHIRSEARVMGGDILEVKVGGRAVRSMEGRISLPSA